MKSLSDRDSWLLVDRIYGVVEQARLYRSCITCDHFNEAAEVCRLANLRPPARTIAMGCPQYFEAPPF